VFIAIRLVFSSKGRLYVTKVTLVVDPTSSLPTPLRNLHPAGTAKGCRVSARDILVVAQAGCNTKIYKLVQISSTSWQKPEITQYALM